MHQAPYDLIATADGVVARIFARGRAVLTSPTINRGTAFTLEEREALGLTGLLPTGVSTLEGQLRRVYAQYRQQANDLRKWVYLANLRDRNEVLFYRLLSEHISEMLPVVYTPTVGWRSNGSARSSAAPAGCTSRSTIPRTSRPHCGTPVSARTTSTCWWPPTPRASWASATRASAASRSPSASSPSTPRPPASTRAGCCRWCWTWAPTTSSCSTTTCTWVRGTPGSAISATTT